MRIVTVVIYTTLATGFVRHIGEPIKPRVRSPARGPYAGETFDPSPVFDPLGPPPGSAAAFCLSETPPFAALKMVSLVSNVLRVAVAYTGLASPFSLCGLAYHVRLAYLPLTVWPGSAHPSSPGCP